MAANTKFDICSRALVEIGVPAISSFEDGSLQSTVAGQLYEPAVENLLSIHRWRFATRQFELTPSAEVPEARWERAYQLPAGTLVIHALTYEGRPVEFDRYGDKLFANLGPDEYPTLDYTYRANESAWPPYFQTTVEFYLAMKFAGAITRNGELADVWRAEHEAQLARAKYIDSQGRTARRVVASRLLTRR